MGLKRAGSALLIPLRPRKSKSAFRRTDYDRQSFCTHAISNRRLHPIRSASTELRQARNRGDTKFHGRSRYATTSSTPPQHVAVLGGGITGLTTAFYLAKQLPPTSTITIYESSDRLGGWMRTQKVQVNVGNTSGLVPFERGPRTLRGLRGDLFRFDDLVLYDLICHIGIKMEACDRQAAGRRYIYYPDHLVDINVNNVTAGLLDEPLLKGALRSIPNLFWNRFVARRGSPPGSDDDVSLGDFWRRALGRSEPVDNIISAIAHGIYGGDIDQLSTRMTNQFMWWNWFRKARRNHVWMPGYEYDLMRRLGDVNAVVEAGKEVPGGMYFPEGGMSSIVTAVEERLGEFENVKIKLNEPVESLKYDPAMSKVRLTTKNTPTPAVYDKVISTVLARTLSRLTDNAVPSLSQPSAVTILAINLWYPAQTHPPLPPGLGYLIPRSVEDNIEGCLGVFFDSNLFPRAPGEPPGTKLFVLMGGHYWDSLPDLPSEEDGVVMAQNVVHRHLGIRVDTPCHAEATLSRDCLPQHKVGHWNLMGRAHEELLQAFGGRLAVAGASYTAAGVLPGIRSGYDIATQVAHGGMPHVGDTGLERFSHQEDIRLVSKAEVAQYCGRVKMVRPDTMMMTFVK